jgi:hypothetical protein
MTRQTGRCHGNKSDTVQTPGVTLCNAIARLSLQRPGFDPKQVVSFVVDKVAQEIRITASTWVSPVTTISFTSCFIARRITVNTARQ